MADLELSVGFDQSTIDKEIDKIDKKVSKLNKSQKASVAVVKELQQKYDSVKMALDAEISANGKSTLLFKQKSAELSKISNELQKEKLVQYEINQQLKDQRFLRRELYLDPSSAIKGLRLEAEMFGKTSNEINRAKKETSGMNKELSKTEPKIKKATNSTKGLSSGLKGAAIGAKSIQSGFEKALKPMKSMLTRINGLIKRVLFFSIIAQSLRVFRDYIGEAVEINDQLSNSLAVVKSNLYTAFAAVYTAVLPALQSFIDWLGRATAYVASFLAALFGSSYKAAQQTAKSFKKQTVATKKLAKETKKANKELDKQLAGFDELNVLSKEVSDDLNDIGGGGDADISTPGVQEPNMPDYSKQTAAAEAFAKKIREIFSGMGEYFKPITDALVRLKERMAPFKEPLMQGLKYTYDNTLIPFANWCTQDFIPQYLDTLAAGFGLIGTVITTLEPSWEELNEKILKPFASEVGNDVVGMLKLIEEGFDDLSEQVEEDAPTTQDTISKFIHIMETMRDTAEPALELLKEKFKEGFKGVVKFTKDGMHDTNELLNGLITFLDGVFSGDWDEAWQGIRKTASSAIDLVIDALGNLIGVDLSPFKEGLKSVLKYVFDEFLPKLAEAWKDARNTEIDAANKMIEGIENMINFIIRGFNKLGDKLNGVIGNLNNIPGVNLPSFGQVGNVSLPRVPYLAQGAVIPPNKEFLAMLGDQKSGTNIEAPAKLIEQIVSKAIQDNGNSGQNEYTFVAQIDGREIFRETVKQNNMYRKRVGRNAFAIGEV